MPTFESTLTVDAPSELNGALTVGGAATFEGLLTTEGAVDLSASTITLPAASIPPSRLVAGNRSIAANGAVVLAANDRFILLENSSDASAKAFTMTATHAGHMVLVRLAARSSSGSYTAAVTGGAVTFDAANEAAWLVYDGSAWQLGGLMGATLV